MAKAIETLYGGCRFRSRLEARWAVFFDALGFPWEYEKEGFDLDGVRYLPDFWIPHIHTWIEIKGQTPSTEEWRKAFRLANHTGDIVVVFAGGIDYGKLGTLISKGNPDSKTYFDILERLGIVDPQDMAICTEDAQWVECPRCNRATISLGRSDKHTSIMCLFCRADGVWMYAKRDKYDPSMTDQLIAAYDAARSARF